MSLLTKIIESRTLSTSFYIMNQHKQLSWYNNFDTSNRTYSRYLWSTNYKSFRRIVL